MTSAGNICFHVRHHFSVPPPKRTTCIGALFMVHGEGFVQRVEVDFLFRNPTQWNNPRRKSINGSGGVWGKTERSLNVSVGHVHQNSLSHVIQIVAQSDDIGPDLGRKVIDALSTEDTAIRAGHTWGIVVLGHHHR